MEEIVLTQWKEGMQFDANIDGFTIHMDALEESGGMNKGPRPKPLLLAGLAGCTGMDVVSILGKMKVSFDHFNILVKAETTEEHPKYYKTIHLVYEFSGKDLPLDKIEKAIILSRDRYCGVNKMLKEVSEITWEVKLNL